jgi:hypothetical protein
MDKVQNKPNSSVQHTPSSESFQVYLHMGSHAGREQTLAQIQNGGIKPDPLLLKSVILEACSNRNS